MTLIAFERVLNELIKVKEEKTNLDNVFYAFYKNNKCFIIKRND